MLTSAEYFGGIFNTSYYRRIAKRKPDSRRRSFVFADLAVLVLAEVAGEKSCSKF